ncbi:hypothetical protein [Clostridium sp.]|uniref:hypothetical protein n=1 Tax=Clostridium sp. TaxID=1506 RepID=UPI002FC9E4AA
MGKNRTSNYGIAFISVILFGMIGLFTIGFSNGIPVGLIIGIIIGLLVSILIAQERIFNLLNDKVQVKKEN